jgi:hypothetical protein
MSRERLEFEAGLRLTQELQDDVSAGRPYPYVTEPGLIIVPIVNRETMTHVGEAALTRRDLAG